MIAGVMIIAGIVASARLFANAHNILQVFSGFALGFAWILMVF
jgi:membrane-associated phospholipid phosphatase